MPTPRQRELYKRFYSYKRRFTRDADRKTRHYALARQLVDIPLLAVYENVTALSWAELPGKVVVKADIGTGATRVKCLQRIGKDRYTDLLRPAKASLTSRELNSFFADKGQILIERFLQDARQGVIPYDFKFYMAFDQLLYVRVVNRNLGTRIAILDHEYRPVCHSEYFQSGFRKYQQEYNLPCTRGALEQAGRIARKISMMLKTPFISVDMFILNDCEFYLGELTWAPGPLVFEPLLPEVSARILEVIAVKENMLEKIPGSLVAQDSTGPLGDLETE